MALSPDQAVLKHYYDSLARNIKRNTAIQINQLNCVQAQFKTFPQAKKQVL